MEDDLDHYLVWPYAENKEFAEIVADAHASVRELLKAVEVELKIAVDLGRPYGRILRLAHEAGALAWMETNLQMMRDEVENEAEVE